MRKHNHLIQPALKQDSRLINSAVRSRQCKRPNALKHGFYSGVRLFPVKIRANIRDCLTS